MRKSRFTESRIVAVLKEGEAGMPIAELCRKHGISSATYYNWKSKYAGAQVSQLHRLRELEAENAKLKRMYADLALENNAIREVLCAAGYNIRWLLRMIVRHGLRAFLRLFFTPQLRRQYQNTILDSGSLSLKPTVPAVAAR